MSFTAQLASDLGSVFLNTGEFAVSGSWTPTGGQAQTVSLIFDNPDLKFDPVSGVTFQGSEIKAHVRRSVFDSAKLGEPIVISSVTYYIRDVKPILDSAGMMELNLSTQAQHG